MYPQVRSGVLGPFEPPQPIPFLPKYEVWRKVNFMLMTVEQGLHLNLFFLLSKPHVEVCTWAFCFSSAWLWFLHSLHVMRWEGPHCGPGYWGISQMALGQLKQNKTILSSFSAVLNQTVLVGFMGKPKIFFKKFCIFEKCPEKPFYPSGGFMKSILNGKDKLSFLDRSACV